MAKDNPGKTVVRRVKVSSAGSSASASADDREVVKKVATAKSSKKTTAKSVEKVTRPVKSTKQATNSQPTFFLLRPIFAIGRYFRDSWRELRQVRWTNRRATWALTLAVIIFCLFFAALIMLFDWIFNWVIQEVIL
jgi:preprotein translocase SecE subunit